jgi:hypothetical protein
MASVMLSPGLIYHVSDETGLAAGGVTAATKERQMAIIVRITNALAFISLISHWFEVERVLMSHKESVD